MERPPRQFYIFPQNWQRVFFCGYNSVSGCVVLDLLEPKLTSGIYVSLTGRARTHWTENESYTDNKGEIRHRQVTRSENFEFLSLRVLLWGPQNGLNADLLAPGQYSFPFTFSPNADSPLPPNFDSKIGKITYTLKASIERPGKYPHRCFLPITLIPVIDCNNPRFNEEVRREDEKHMCCLCCASGPIVATARIPAHGWCPGELVPFYVTLENHTKKPMSDITCALDYRTSFHAHGHSNSESKRVAQQKLGRAIPPGGEVKETIYLRVPSCCPSFTRHVGRIISHEYTMVVTIHLPAGSFNLHLRFPVTIGTIPHMSPPLFREQRAEMQMQNPVYSWASAEQISKMAAASAPPTAPSAPSTYEDAYTDSTDPDASSLGGQMQYVYFEMPQSAAPPMMGSAPVAGNERAPLLGSAPVPVSGEPTTTTTTTSAPGGAPASMFAAPCAVMDIPPDDQ